jgi:putative drug exporter of the RND superfamily
LGRKVFWPRVPALGSTPPTPRTPWARALDRPVRTAAITAVVLGALSIGVVNLSTDLREADAFTSTPESVTGFETLARAYPGQGGRPLTVATPTRLVGEATATARGINGVVDVETTRSGDGWTLLDVVPAAAPDSAAEGALVGRLRSELPTAALVGGQGAERVDVEAASTRDTWLVIPIVLGVVLLVLFVLLRALALSLLVVGAVVLSFVAALGLGTLVFGGLLGFAGAEPTMPVLAFVFLVAFGVDYAIFLVTRIAEDRVELGTEAAARRAVTATGPVIVSAGLVLAATFAVLASLPFVPMVEIGIVVSVGVLLQTLLVAPALVAPLVVGLRRWVWWPGRTRTTAQEKHIPIGSGRR